MEEIRDPYNILGVSPDADDREIKQAFRKKSFTCHPTLFHDDPDKGAEFRQIKAAYDMIDTEIKRRGLKNRVGVSLRKGPEGAQTSYYRKMFRVE